MQTEPDVSWWNNITTFVTSVFLDVWTVYLSDTLIYPVNAKYYL